MSDLAEFYNTESELLHKALYLLHADIFWSSLERIKEAILMLHKLEAENVDLRPTVRKYISEFETLRTSLEQIGHSATDFRTRLIRENGCDSSCEITRESKG